MRVVNRILSFLLWLAVAGAAVVAAVEIVLALVGQPPWLVDRSAVAATVRTATWTDPTVQLGATVAVVVGAVLLLAELKPRRPRTVPVAEDDGRRVEIDRRGLERLLRAEALADRDVTDAKVRWRRFRLRVRATVPEHADRDDTKRRVRERVTSRLGQLGLDGVPRLAVRTREQGRVS